jgi:tRNA (cytidine/uridine-2'-O-)-methyltransferase
MLRVVLVHPQIPPNTGNVARTCAATSTELHLVGPLGFEISDRYLKRAGLDYWPYVNLHYHESIDAFRAMYQQQVGAGLALALREHVVMLSSSFRRMIGCCWVAKPWVYPLRC